MLPQVSCYCVPQYLMNNRPWTTTAVTKIYFNHTFSFKQCIIILWVLNVTAKVYYSYIVVLMTKQTNSKVIQSYAKLESCFNKFQWKQTLSSWYYTSISHQWLKLSVVLAQVPVKCKLYLTATCVCVHLMSSRVEWDCGMSAMNTQLIRKCHLIMSHPAHDYTFCSTLSFFRVCDVCFVLEHLVSAWVLPGCSIQQDRV